MFNLLCATAILFLPSGFKLTGGTCRTWETRLCDLAEVKDECMDTEEMSDLVDLLSFKFFDTVETKHIFFITIQYESEN